MKTPILALLAGAFAIASFPLRSSAVPPPYSGDGQYSPTSGWVYVNGKPNKDFIRINGMIQYAGEKSYALGSVVLKVGEITSVRKTYGLSLPSMTPTAPAPGADDDSALITIKLERDPYPINVYAARNAEGFLQQLTGWIAGEEIKRYQ
jgi:hypothetical protein